MTEAEREKLRGLANLGPHDSFDPERELDDAFEIVHATSEAGWHWFLDNRIRYPQQDRPWRVTCSQPIVGRVIRRFHDSFAGSVTEAICQAALLALEEGTSEQRSREGSGNANRT